MARSVVPTVVLDTRDGDEVTAQSIGSLPSELSDRSNSAPQVVIIEACGNQFDKLLYQINRWPSAVISKCLNLVGIQIEAASAATVTQTFTLSNPQPADTVIPAGTQVQLSDGTVTFETLDDLTISAYTNQAGTISTTAGSATVTGSGTSFTSDLIGQKIEVTRDSGVWYIVSAVGGTTTLTISTTAAATVSGASWRSGPYTGTVAAQSTTTGLDTNAAATELDTLVSSPANVASTSNAAAAAGGTDEEDTDEAIARAQSEFAARDVACSATDYEVHARRVLGEGSRAVARAGYNVNTASSSYVTLAVLSPTWTTSSPSTTQERASVTRDLAGRIFVGSNFVDVSANITSFNTSGATPSVCVYRKSNFDETTVKINVAAAINDWLSPNTYPWEPSAYTNGYRPIYLTDLIDVVESAEGVDRVELLSASGSLVPCIGMNYRTASNNITFTNASTSATCNAGDSANMTAGKTVLVDSTNKKAYLVTAISMSTTLTLHTAFTGSSGAVAAVPFFTPADTNLTDWTYLPYSNLSVDEDSPAASIFVVGSV
jgi:hypothetical protein